MAGKYPGSWSLPVCNASTWGQKWNVNYENHGASGGSIPCFCGKSHGMSTNLAKFNASLGERGQETAAWAKAAGMDGFETYSYRCTHVLRGKCFQWPSNMTDIMIGPKVRVYKPAPGQVDFPDLS